MTRTKMRSLFRSLIDESNVAGQIFKDPRINELLFEGAQTVQDLIEDNDEHHFEVEETFTIAGGSSTHPLNDNLRKIKSLLRTNSSEVKQIKYLDIRYFDRYIRDYNDNNVYGLRGTDIVFPAPMSGDTTFNIVYTSQLEDLEGDEEQWTAIPIFARRLVVYEAAMIGLTSENSEIESFSLLLSDLRSKVIRALENRADNSSKGVSFEE